MKVLKPKFWNTKVSFLAITLLPFSLIIWLLILIKKKITTKLDFKIPIICVGNIYVGGTGKTPLAVVLAKEIKLMGKNPAILKKFYESHQDEHNLIEKNFNNLILEKDRSIGINKAIEQGFDTIILDDGLQEYRIKKNFSIVCFNEKQLIGNGFVFPAGPLREGLNALNNVDIIVINGKENKNFQKKILKINPNLSFFYSEYKLKNYEQFKNKKLLAIAGIGNPSNFFDLLEEKGLVVAKKLIYPDHYEFSKKELLEFIEIGKKNNYEIVFTEKDYFRIKKYNLSQLKFMQVELIVPRMEEIKKKILNIYD